jgi:CHAT domain-containing protein
VIIVPDGALHGLNFETLPVDGPRRHYWIEDVELQVAPALALLTESASAPSVAPALLAIGNPTSTDPQFPPLRYASAEMSSIAGHFVQDTTSWARASPAAYREAGPERFTLVHFAAHAAANVDSPLDSAVILAGSDLAHKLYARDVATMPLRAELVTVSACRSAGEQAYTGEGLIGFAWAFLRAGARRVVAGLWDVDDRSTAELMDSMYARLAAGDSPPSALRQAKLALLARGGTTAKPYYWGPFQVFTVVAQRRDTK